MNAFLWQELSIKLFEQIYLVLAAILISIAIGIPLGIWMQHKRKVKTIVFSVANVLQTIPSLALLTLLLPIFGIGIKPALTALILYSLLPILRNTLTGLENVPKASKEAARALGFNYFQRLYLVELPLAAPVIVAGVRTAAVICTGVATLAAFIGAGGLGDFIYRGLALNDMRLVMLGAIPAALLSLFLDFMLSWIEKDLLIWKRKTKSKGSLWGIALILCVVFGLAFFNTSFLSAKTIRIGSKDFTEQFILGEIMAQLIEAKTDLKVERKFNLGSTAICHSALLKNQIDLYPEYTGTAYMAILHHQTIETPEKTYSQTKDIYAKEFGLTWLKPYGFENTQRLAVRENFAKKYHLKTTSDLVPLAPTLTIAGPAEFHTRLDAGPALYKTYHIRFKEVKTLSPTLMFKAIYDDLVDVIFAFSTDGRIPSYHLVLLEDDKHAVPPYFAAPVIRSDVLKKYPELETVLNQLANTIDNTTMQKLNNMVDMEKKSITVVAREFLQEKKLLN